MTSAFNESFNDNTPDALKTMKPDIDKLFAAISKVGEEIEAGPAWRKQHHIARPCQTGSAVDGIGHAGGAVDVV